MHGENSSSPMSPWTESRLPERRDGTGSVLCESEAESVSWVVNQHFKVFALIVYLGFVKQKGTQIQVHHEQTTFLLVCAELIHAIFYGTLQCETNSVCLIVTAFIRLAAWPDKKLICDHESKWKVSYFTIITATSPVILRKRVISL